MLTTATLKSEIPPRTDKQSHRSPGAGQKHRALPSNGPNSVEAKRIYAQVEEIVPILRAQNADTEARRWIGDDISQRLKDIGVYQLFAPKRFGGFEMNTYDALTILTKLGEGCASASWVAGIHNAAVWLAALYDDKAQEEILGGDEKAVISGVLAPTGRFEQVEGGYLLTGKWGYASGVLDANWLLMGGPRYLKDGTKLDEVYALVPVSKIKVFDDWDTVAMCGTGSHSVAVDKVFVPEHHLIDPAAAARGEIPSKTAGNIPLYRSAFLPVLSAVLVTPALGAVRAMFEEAMRQIPNRRITYTSYSNQAEAVSTQNRLAEAASLIDEAQFHTDRLGKNMDKWAESGSYMEFADRALGRLDIGRGLDLCRSAANLLFAIAGSGAIARSNPMQRYFRDIHGAASHALQMPIVQYEVYGKMLLDQPQITPLV